jgi:hypothetical protein
MFLRCDPKCLLVHHDLVRKPAELGQKHSQFHAQFRGLRRELDRFVIARRGHLPMFGGNRRSSLPVEFRNSICESLRRR